MKKIIPFLGVLGFVLFFYYLFQYIRNNSPVDVDYFNNNIKESFGLYVAYKNSGRQYGLYLSKDMEKVRKIVNMHIKSGEPYNVPAYPDIEFSVRASIELFDAADIGDKVEKLPNSNKCYLYKKDSIFKYNCYLFTDKERQAIGKRIDEWSSNETGFWKLVK